LVGLALDVLYFELLEKLTAKLGLPNPTIKITAHKTQEHQSFSYRLDILESTFMDKIGTLQEDSF
jgi:hypothetical protein